MRTRKRHPRPVALLAALDEQLAATSAREGDRFTARVAEPVPVAGREAVPSGAVVYGRVVGVREARGEEGTAVVRLAFQIVRVRAGSPILSARLLEVRPEVRSGSGAPKESASRSAARSAVGTVLPAAAAGTGVDRTLGTGVVLAADGARAVLPAGGELRLELTDPLLVRTP